MSSQAAPPAAAHLEQNRGIDWRHVAIVSIAGCGPAASIALNLPFMGQFAGAALVLAFIVVWPGVLLLVNTFAEFARRISAAGGLYTWNARALGKDAGFVYGWTFIGAYLLVAAGGFTIFGAFLSEFLESQFGVDIPWWILMGAGMIYVAVLSVLGVTQSLHATFALLAFEVVLLLALSVYMLVDVGPANWSTLPFRPGAASTAGLSAFGLAMTFAVLSHVGMEEGATLGEEASRPRFNIPRGLWVTGILVPTFYVLVSYAIVVGYGADKIQEAFANDLVPLQTLADRYWGSAGLTVIVFASSASILAFTQAAFLAGVRVLYTLGREGILTSWLGGVSRRGTPERATYAMLAACLVFSVPVAIAAGPFNTWGYFGFLIGIAFLVLYIITNFAMVAWTWGTPEFNWLRHGVFGLLGAALFCYPLYRDVIPLQPGVYGKLPFVYLGWLAIGVVLLVQARMQRPEIVAAVGTAVAEVDEAEPELVEGLRPERPAAEGSAA